MLLNIVSLSHTLSTRFEPLYTDMYHIGPSDGTVSCYILTLKMYDTISVYVKNWFWFQLHERRFLLHYSWGRTWWTLWILLRSNFFWRPVFVLIWLGYLRIIVKFLYFPLSFSNFCENTQNYSTVFFRILQFFEYLYFLYNKISKIYFKFFQNFMKMYTNI